MSNTKTATFKNLKGIIWDLDNTLYRAHQGMDHAYHLAAARLAVRDGVEPSMDVALEKARKSYEEREFSGRFLITEHGYDVPHLHKELHDLIDETAIVKSIETADLLRELDLKNALVTHGSQSWAHRVLAHLDLVEFFAHDAILSLESYDFQRKNESSAGVEMALKALDLAPDQVVMVEDIAHNLNIPYDMGIFTVFVHHGRKPDNVPDYVDAQYSNAIELLEDIKSNI